MSWDFAARSGVATVSDFDGFTVSGAMNATSLAASASANTFSGGLTGGGLTGGLDGSFVGGPLGSTQGVIGSFDLTGAGFTATGIVAGEQP